MNSDLSLNNYSKEEDMRWPAASVIISFIVTIGAIIIYTQYLKYLLTLNHILPITGFN